MKHKHYNIADYVPSIYKKEAYVDCYSSMIYPANGQNLWMKTEYTDLQPPAIKKQPGRPKKKRRLDASELLKEEGQMKRASYGIKCSRCKQSGHNKSRCPLPPLPPPESETQASQVPPSQPQAQVETQTSQPQVSQTQATHPQATQSQNTQAPATQSQASQTQTTQKQNASTRKRKAKEPVYATQTTQSQTSHIPPTRKPSALTKKRKASHQVSATQPKQATKLGSKGRKKGGSATQPM